MSRPHRGWWLLALVPIAAIVLFVAWAGMASAPMPEAHAALQSDAEVEVSTNAWFVFQSQVKEPTTGLILYPGGRVDPRAYAPLGRAIATQGYLVVIVPMPLNLAFLAPNRAERVIAAFPNVQHWAVGGHSLGGAMAARFVHRNPTSVQGLVLWASYPAASDDLSARDLAVASIYGTLDGLATPAKIDASRPLLPLSTTWAPIQGGNHAQFGWYGPQSGDNPAAISREDQQDEIVTATLDLLAELAVRGSSHGVE